MSVSMSRWSAASGVCARRDGVISESASVTTAALLRELIQLLDDLVEFRRVDLRRSCFPRPARVYRIAGLPEDDPLFFLPVVEFRVHGKSRRVQAGLRGRVDESGRAKAFELREEDAHLLLVGIHGLRAIGALALPLVLDRRRAAFDLVERGCLAAARELQTRRIVRAEREEILASVILRAFLQLVDQRAVDRHDERL